MLAGGLKALGYSFLADPVTNMIFPILPNALIQFLQDRYDFYVWCQTDEEHSAIRLVTSWATPAERVEAFLDAARQGSARAG
jgi:threonine aldolase